MKLREIVLEVIDSTGADGLCKEFDRQFEKAASIAKRLQNLFSGDEEGNNESA